ncbi:MAG: bacteriohemerythrin [Methyloprofundus sp.]|nr:bacteriohemerythrin [Methyloprofundus sp.]
MAVVQWDDKYSVGLSAMDNDHKQLFSILDSLYGMMADDVNDQEINTIIQALLDYTHYHFSEEENVMQKMQYPELAQHQELHKKFIAQLEVYQQEATSEGMAIFVAVKIANTGSQWLKDHILVVDRKYQKFMEKQAS